MPRIKTPARVPPASSQRSPDRIPPGQVPEELLERIVGKRVVFPTHGDILIVREVVPSLRTTPTGRWRYRLSLYDGDVSAKLFTSFAHAASQGEALAADRRARLLYREDDAVMLLNDYRPGR